VLSVVVRPIQGQPDLAIRLSRQLIERQGRFDIALAGLYRSSDCLACVLRATPEKLPS
jgi:hypothetical protein